MSVLNQLLPGFGLNLVMAIIIIGFIYIPSNNATKEYVFTFFAFNVMIYFVSGLLRDVQVTIGFGFGLLAVFSTLRYRTVNIPLKEMTYLFICISLPFINTLFMATRIQFRELIIIDSIIVVILFLLEKGWVLPLNATKVILYEKIDLIRPENYDQLLEDLRQRTGLDIQRCEVVQIDFLRDTAQVAIYYRPESTYRS